MKLVVDDTRPSQVLTREAFENAIAAIAGDRRLDERRAAPARDRRRGRHRARRSTTSTRSRRARRSSPTSSPAAATSRPISSRRAASRSSRASSSAAASSTRTRRGVDGRTLKQVADGAFERPGQKVVVSWDNPLKPTGGLAILRGNLAPDGCVVKLAGHERHAAPRPGARLRLRGSLLRSRQGAGDRAGRRRRHPLRGSGRRARACARCCTSRRRSSARGSVTRSR